MGCGWIGWDRIGSNQTGLDRIGSGRIGLGQIRSDRIGTSDRAGSNGMGQGWAERSEVVRDRMGWAEMDCDWMGCAEM